MRHWLMTVAGLALVGCADGVPTSVAPDASSGSAGALNKGGISPIAVFNTQLRAELEVPACVSDSKGHAQIKVLENGTIESKVILNNKDAEVVRFGHIHHILPGEPTGPVIWWLTSPVGVMLNLTDRHLEFRQTAIFTANTHFTSHAAALAALLSDPDSFYVNFHSADCPGGFARGFLP